MGVKSRAHDALEQTGVSVLTLTPPATEAGPGGTSTTAPTATTAPPTTAPPG